MAFVTRFPLLALLFFAPLPVLGYVNLARAMSGKGLEPFADNVVGYFMLFIVFGAGALAVAAVRDLRKPWISALSFVRSSVAGALGSTTLTTVADLFDSYFTPPGIGWAWPLTGVAMGASLGAAYGMLRSWPGRHVR